MPSTCRSAVGTDHDPGTRQGALDLKRAALHALSKTYFALPSEQRNRTHLPQIDPDRVIGVESFFRAAGTVSRFGAIAVFIVFAFLFVVVDYRGVAVFQRYRSQRILSVRELLFKLLHGGLLSPSG